MGLGVRAPPSPLHPSPTFITIMITLADQLTNLADQLDALLADVEKVEKADVKNVKSSLDRIQRASTEALERLATAKRKPVVMAPVEDWSDIVVRGLEPKT